MTASASVVEALRAMKDLDTRAHHDGYDDGPGGGNYIYRDVVFTDELYPLIDKVLSALNTPQPAEQDAREAVARIIAPDALRLSEDAAWAADRHAARIAWKSALSKADAILALTQAAPDGWVLVPVEPTPAMVEAAVSASSFYVSTYEEGVTPIEPVSAIVYLAMLSASPAPPAQGAKP